MGNIVFLRKIYSYSSQKFSGLSVISLYQKNLDNILSATQDSILSLTDMNGETVFLSDKIGKDGLWEKLSENQDVYSEDSGVRYFAVDGKDYMVNYSIIPEAGWKLYYILPRTAATKEITELWNSTLTIVMLVFLCTMILCIVLVFTATKPVTQLLKLAQKVKIGGYVLEEDCDEEIYNLKDAEKMFTRLMLKMERLVAAVLEDQKREYQLRYQMLRAQINPHFLFNTLNSIKWSAMMSGSQNVADMISDLGVLLDASLNRGEDLIPLRDEIRLIRSYAELKSLAMKYPFSVQYKISTEMEDYLVLKFTLQPIVENAAKHGITKRKDGIITIIVLSCGNGDIEIHVTDNGEGMTPQELETLCAKLQAPFSENTSDSGLGLKSIHHIIRMRYGAPYGVSVTSESMKGTDVCLLLPGNPKDYDYIKSESEEQGYAESSNCRR